MTTITVKMDLRSMFGPVRDQGQRPTCLAFAVSDPYLAELPADLTQWGPPVGVAPLFRRAGEPGKDTVESVIEELERGRPVLTLLRLSASFDWAKGDGVVDPGANEKPDLFRRHAVISVGHGDINGQRAVLIRNSWGHGWGASGYGWLTEKFLRPRIFKLAILKEDLSVSPHTAAA